MAGLDPAIHAPTMFSFYVDARLKAGVTQVELAEKVGTDQQNISRLESGRNAMLIDTLQEVAAALGLTLEIRLK